MKKIYTVFILSLCIFTLQAQNEFVATNNASVTVQDGALLYVNGTIQNDNSSITNDGTIELTGDWIQDGTASHDWSTSGIRTVIFRNLAGDQQTIEGTADVSFYNVLIDNNALATAGAWTGGVRIDRNVTISNVLDFENTTTSMLFAGSNIITIENDEPNAIINNSLNRFIMFDGSGNGELRRKVSSGETYYFPIGTEWSGSGLQQQRNYASFEIDLADLPTGVEYLTATFRHQANPGPITGTNPNFAPSWGGVFDCSPDLPANQHIVLDQTVQEYGTWEIRPLNSDFSTGERDNWDEYDITFYPDWNKVQANNSFVMYKALKGPHNIAYGVFDWGDYVLNSGDPCSGINEVDIDPYPANLTGIAAHGITSFSKFSLAGNGSVQLPVELLYLKAEPVNNEFIRVSWSTSVEINNAGFYLERSLDGQNFEEISWIPGNGNTTDQMYYSYNDMDVVHNQVYYYRLRQIDFDGTYEYTYIVNASLIKGDIFDISDFRPNPTADQSHIVVTSSTDREITVRIFNTLGQLVMDKMHQIAPGQYSIDFDFRHLADGTYHAVFMTNNEIYNRKLILTK